MAAQFTLRKVRWERAEALWMRRAITSLPTPLSPSISTGTSTRAT